jgi:phage tail-like protein
MSGVRDLNTVRFVSPEHWTLGLGKRAAIDADGVTPLRPLARTGRVITTTGGASAPAIGPDGTLYWLGGDGQLAWLMPDAASPCRMPAPDVARSTRLVAGRSWLWTAAPGGTSLARYDTRDLRQDDAMLPAAPGPIVDMTGDGHDGVWVLTKDCLWHVTGKGNAEMPVPVPRQALGVARLGSQLVMLVADADALVFVHASAPGQATRTVAIRTAGFVARRIDSDNRSRIFLTGTPAATVLWLDAHGGLVQTLQAAPFNGAAARLGAVWLTGANGLTEYAGTPASASDAGADATYWSPRLHSPDTGALRGWLRAELSVHLPRGSTMTVSVMSTGDKNLADAVQALSHDTNRSPADRQDSMASLLQAGTRTACVFAASGEDAQQCAVPMFDHSGPWLWISITLTAAPDGALSGLRELRVLYPDISLMQHLPAIFHGDVTARTPHTGDPGGVLRRLVGVLETTTQELDRTIGALARNFQPLTAPGPWLNYMARWFDLPWHDALPEATRRKLLAHGEELLSKRGTRAGLKLLLSVLTARARVRIADHNVDHGLLILGGGGRAGIALPSVIGGLPAHAAVLSCRTLLGQARLGCNGDAPSATARFVDLIRVEISMHAAQRAALAHLLPALLQAMVPAGMRVIVRWRPAQAGAGTGDITLDDPDVRRLAQDSALGLIRLGRSGHRRLANVGASTDIYLD